MKKNDIVEIRIEDMAKTGEGIGRVDGYTLFVKDAVAGDIIKARVTKTGKTYGFARLEEIVKPSSVRVPGKCRQCRRCGGCNLQEMSYEAQLKLKEKHVTDALTRIGGIKEPNMKPILPSPEMFRYRNKAQYPIGYKTGADGKKELCAGFYAGRTHSIIECDDCLLTPPVFSLILREFLAFLRDKEITAYDEKTGKGLVRHLLLRISRNNGGILVCPVINGRRFPFYQEMCERIGRIAHVSGICVNINTSSGNRILGNEVKTLSGEPFITERLGDLLFRVSPLSFFQVNTLQAERLYGAVLEACALTGREVVYDLYCGTGTISLFLARKAAKVYGVEIVPDAVRDAKLNALANGITNAEFYAGSAEEIITRGYFGEGVPCPHADVVVVDPPRKGCGKELLDTMLAMKPDRIVYVSCDPATLARDLKILLEDGTYRFVFARPTDMFPMVSHVETCCLLERLRNAKDYIPLKLDMEDYYKIKDAEEETKNDSNN